MIITNRYSLCCYVRLPFSLSRSHSPNYHCAIIRFDLSWIVCMLMYIWARGCVRLRTFEFLKVAYVNCYQCCFTFIAIFKSQLHYSNRNESTGIVCFNVNPTPSLNKNKPMCSLYRAVGTQVVSHVTLFLFSFCKDSLQIKIASIKMGFCFFRVYFLKLVGARAKRYWSNSTDGKLFCTKVHTINQILYLLTVNNRGIKHNQLNVAWNAFA